MTIIEAAVGHEAPDNTLWHEVERGLWVGNDAGAFLGSIELIGSLYRAIGPVSNLIGEFPSLERARDAITARD